MRFYPENRDNGPIRYAGRVPVYATTILAVLYCAGMFLTVIIQAAHGPTYLFQFSTEEFFLRGWLWQIATCTFVNLPDFYFVFWLLFFYQFAVEIERFFGRRTFFKFYALLLVTVALTLGAWRLTGRPGSFHSMEPITMGMFIGYVTLYPNLEYLDWVPLKYIAFACLALSALSYFSHNDWQGLSIVFAVCVASFGFIRYAKLGGSLELGDWAKNLNPFRRRPKFRVMPSPERMAPRSNVGGLGTGASVDAILDKIARSGFASLTQEERDQLERARDILNKKRQ